MPRFEKGDRVRIDLPDETDPDHDELHGEHGTVATILEDDAGEATGDGRDSHLFRIELDNSETIDLRWRDLRPPFE